jgi:hypothetical protein
MIVIFWEMTPCGKKPSKVCENVKYYVCPQNWPILVHFVPYGSLPVTFASLNAWFASSVYLAFTDHVPFYSTEILRISVTGLV